MRPPPPDDVRAPGVYCMESCVAALIECPVSEVPNVHDEADRLREAGEDVRLWWRPLIEWLWSRGMTVREWLVEHVDAPDGWAIAVGPSPRKPKSTHAVIVRDGELEWDPYLDDPVGLTEGVGRYWTVEFL